ncbi:MAG: ABC transporter permease [Ilumatobacteraceae bacterium]
MAGSTASASEVRPARWWVPWVLMLPGLLWLLVFFAIPMVSMGKLSLDDGGFGNYADAFSNYRELIPRTFLYAFLATIICVLLGYPLAYVIAMRGGRRKNLLLALVVLPFFTTYLIRAISWRVLLGDQGPVPRVLRSLNIIGENTSIVGTAPAVVGALAYNFLPFMVLPIYVSLEKVDRRLLEAGPDLYASGWRTFRKVTFPLSLPGLFAGSLLTFIPASGDFINVEFVGSDAQRMIGNVVSANFPKEQFRPELSALSFVLMALILGGVLLYARLLGTEEIV